MRIKLWQLNTQAVNGYFDKIDSFNQTLKEQLLSISELQNKTPENIEQLLKNHYYSWCKQDKNELIRVLLEKRKYLLNKSFEYTPENIENLLRVNRILSEGAEKVLSQAQKLHKTMQTLNDGFTQDFEIDGTVRVSYNGNESLIDFNPNFDKDKAPFPNPPHIMEIIDSATPTRFPQDLFSCHYDDRDREIDDDDIYCEDGWRFTLRRDCPEFQGNRCSWAFHNLADHSLYALQDIVRINDFWNEVTVIYQNFDGDKLIVEK